MEEEVSGHPAERRQGIQSAVASWNSRFGTLQCCRFDYGTSGAARAARPFDGFGRLIVLDTNVLSALMAKGAEPLVGIGWIISRPNPSGLHSHAFEARLGLACSLPAAAERALEADSTTVG